MNIPCLHKPHRYSLLPTLNFIIFYLILCCILLTPSSLCYAESDTFSAKDLLYTVLVAELAASRDLKNIACENYFKAAYITQDPAIAAEATLVAVNFEAPKEALLNAILWAKIDPNNLQAQLMAMTLLLSQSTEQALPYLKKALDLKTADIDQQLIEIQVRLSETSAQNLANAIESVAKERLNDASVQFIAAQSTAVQNNIKKAKYWINAALTLKPNFTKAIQLKSQIILHETETEAQALKYLNQELTKFPGNTELRIFYANSLLDAGKNEEAKRIASLVPEKSVFRGASLLLGEIYLKEENWKRAENHLKKSLNFSDTKESAKYLLGELEEHLQHPEKAILWYSQVQQGPFYVPAMLQAVTLLKKAGHYEEAIYLLHNANPSTLEEQKYLLLSEIDLLNTNKDFEEALQISNEILTQLPNDIDVLFMRAITATKLKKWEMAENDLKKILDQNPDDPNTLNALGYTLSFNKQRLKEALEYSKQALVTAPNNPEFNDSVGWVYYQMGDLDRALYYLKIANELSQDNIIAAHFGEVLWMSDQKNKAMLVWKKALQENMEKDEILETLKRLKVKF